MSKNRDLESNRYNLKETWPPPNKMGMYAKNPAQS